MLTWALPADAYEAEQLLKEVDIHSVTGVLKLYLRELPEALFTDALYPELLRAWGATQVVTLYFMVATSYRSKNKTELSGSLSQ